MTQEAASAATGKYTTFTPAELKQSMQRVEGTSVVATANEDGTPNAAIFVPMMVDESHVAMTLAKNATRANIERTGACVVVYDVANAAAPDKAGRHKGARLTLELMRAEDADYAEVSAAWPHMNPYTMLFRVTAVRQIG